MVDLSVLQPVSWFAGAIGVCVAAFYYAMNLRETTRNRKIQFSVNSMQTLWTEESNRRLIDLMSMEWNDFNDFVKKYDSTVNPDNYSKRWAFWSACETLGYLHKSGLIDLDTLYVMVGDFVLLGWMKFKSVIEEYRKGEFSKDRFENWESLAYEVSLIKGRRDPNYKGALTIFKPEDYDKAFKR